MPKNRKSSVIPFVRSNHGHSPSRPRLARPSRAASVQGSVRPARERSPLTAASIDGSPAISWDDLCVVGDSGSIDAVDRRGTRRSRSRRLHVARTNYPSVPSRLRYRSVKTLRCTRTLDKRGAARRKRCKAAGTVIQRRYGPDADQPKTWTIARSLRSRRRSFDPTTTFWPCCIHPRTLRSVRRARVPRRLKCGPGRYERHLATGRPLPDETQAYVATLAHDDQRARTNVQLGAVAKSFAWATLHCSLRAPPASRRIVALR